MKNLLYGLVLVSIMLAGCAGPGKLTRKSVTMPNGEKITVVTHNQKVPDWMLSKNKLSLNYIVKGEVTDSQLAAISAVEKAGREYTKKVRPSDWTTVLSSGIFYAAAGYAGVGLGSMAFHGAVSNEYALYGAAATGFSGLVNGLIMRGGQTYTFEVFGMQTLDGMFPSYGIKVLIKSPY